jgi:isoquinoline 1-oxidoreductase alpha subunit
MFVFDTGRIVEFRNFSCISSYMITLHVNKRSYQMEVDENTPLLWVLRDVLGLTGTKYGCGVAQCGACVVHLNGEAVRSCITRVKRAADQEVVTIEGLSAGNDHPLQKAWAELSVPQCGYCHSGQLMSAAVLLRENPHPSDADIDAAMAGNICRCGTYLRIRHAIHRAAELQGKSQG